MLKQTNRDLVGCIMSFKKKSKEVEKATGINNHTQAYILICQAIGLKDLERRLEDIKKKQVEIGHLSNELYGERTKIYYEMNERGRNILGAEEYDKYFYSKT